MPSNPCPVFNAWLVNATPLRQGCLLQEKGRAPAAQKSAADERAGRRLHAGGTFSARNSEAFGLCDQEGFCWFLVPTKFLFIIGGEKEQREKKTEWYFLPFL